MSIMDGNKIKIVKNLKHILRELTLDLILDTMIAEDVFTLDDVQRINSKVTQTDKNREFVRHLLKAPDKGYGIFIAILKEDKPYEELAELIDKTEISEEKQTEKIPISEEHKCKIMKNIDSIVADLKLDYQLDTMVQEGVFTFDDVDRIDSKVTQTDKNEEFVRLLLKAPGNGYGIFINTLKESESCKLAQQIKNTEVTDEAILEMRQRVEEIETKIVTRANIEDVKLEVKEVEKKVFKDIQDVKLKVEDVEKKVSEDIQDVKLKVEEVEKKVSEDIQGVKVEVEKKMSEDMQNMRQQVKEVEKKMSDFIPANIQDQIKNQLEDWQKEDQTFVPTRASKQVQKSIKEKNCVIIIGSSGVGKSFIMRHVSLIMKDEGYKVIPTCIPKEIRDFTNTKPGSKTLFVVDDIGGHYVLNQKYIDDWKLMLPYISPLLEKNLCKIIATTRLQVFQDMKFKDLSIFISNECNLNSEDLCLTVDEKTSFAKKYFGDQAGKVSEMSNKFEFFPLLCRLYDKDKFSDLSEFLSKPFECYKQELDHLLNEGDEGKYKYCVLALVVMFNNEISEKHFSGDCSKIIEITLDKCELNRGTSVECLKRALHTLEGSFVVKDGDCYKTVHDKLFDFLAKFFGDKMLKCMIDNATTEFINERIVWNTSDNIETNIDFTICLPDDCLDMYINRLVNDWSDGKVISLFCSKNMKSPTFILKLLDHIKCKDKSFQVKLANTTVDNGYHDTMLMLSCFVGDGNLSQWILQNTSHKNKLSQLLRSHPIVDKCGDDGTSPVYIACQEGHLSVLDRLIQCKADINKCNNDGFSPVFIACQVGHVNILNTLIQNKADVNKCDDNGLSPLHAACNFNHIDVVLVLLKLYKKNKVMIDLCDNRGITPLYEACKQGHVNIVTTLLQHGANPHQCNKKGKSPLQVADDEGHVNVVTVIRQFKPNY